MVVGSNPTGPIAKGCIPEIEGMQPFYIYRMIYKAQAQIFEQSSCAVLSFQQGDEFLRMSRGLLRNIRELLRVLPQVV